MDRGAWWATVHGVTKSWTRLSTHSLTPALQADSLPSEQTREPILSFVARGKVQRDSE